MITIQKDTDSIGIRDYRHALFLHLRPRPVFAVAGILMLLLVLFGLIQKLFSPEPCQPFILLICGVFLYLVIYFFYYLPKSAASNFKNDRFSKYKATYLMDDHGFHSTSELGNTVIPWDHFLKWKADRRMILLYPYQTLYFIFPRHLFTDDSWVEFRSLVAKKIKKID